jgi:hypothetical protein
MRTFSTGRPVILAAAPCAKVGTCVPSQMSQPFSRRSTVQFIGSIVAWARNGIW